MIDDCCQKQLGWGKGAGYDLQNVWFGGSSKQKKASAQTQAPSTILRNAKQFYIFKHSSGNIRVPLDAWLLLICKNYLTKNCSI